MLIEQYKIHQRRACTGGVLPLMPLVCKSRQPLQPLSCHFQGCKPSTVCFRLSNRSVRCRSSNKSATGTMAIGYLTMSFDGFDAAKAVAAYPQLQQLHMDSDIETNLEIIIGLLPARLHGQLFTSHPQLLQTDMQSWVDFLTSFGFQETQIADAIRSCPEVFYCSNIFQAGQLLLFLRHTLQVPIQQVIQDCFKWAAALGPQVTQASMAAVADSLQQQLGLTERQLLSVLQQFPEVLGWDVQQDLLPKLEFFNALGPAGKQLLSGTLYDADFGYLPGLRSWHYSVEPKVRLLAMLLGSEGEALSLISRTPGILKLPVETKLQPVLTALVAAGLEGQQLAQLLRECPKLLGESKEQLVSRVNFLVDAIGCDIEDVLQYPQYLLLSLSDTIGPRYYFLARLGQLDDFSDPSTGTLQLQRVLQPPLDAFLADVAKMSDGDVSQVLTEYQELKAEWDNLLGWCCDKAFSSIDGQVSSLYQEQVNMFYVLVQ